MRSTLLRAGALLALTTAVASAQTLVFANTSVEFSDVTVTGSNLQVKIKGPTGAVTTRSVPAASVVRVEWPQPAELLEAEGLLLAGKYPEALAVASKVQELHRLWKDKPGSWYAGSSLLVAESLLRQNKYDEASRLMSELRTMSLGSTMSIRVALLDALEQYLKGITGPALTKATALTKGTDDSATLVRVNLLIGDIQFKREAYTEALDAYLQVPVFYGAQAAFLPAAELGAARTLARLRRMEDAAASLNRIVERYTGTPEADAAKTELSSLTKALGQSG